MATYIRRLVTERQYERGRNPSQKDAVHPAVQAQYSHNSRNVVSSTDSGNSGCFEEDRLVLDSAEHVSDDAGGLGLSQRAEGCNVIAIDFGRNTVRWACA